MKKNVLMMMLGLMLFTVFAVNTGAGELDLLLDKLVDKKIVTPVEAQIIADETKFNVSKNISDGKAYSAPSWVQKISMKGDFRLRYQSEDGKGKTVRERERYRFRLGAEAKAAKNVKLGFGLCTGSSDPRSTNQTMQDTFATQDIRLDYAFVKYDVCDNSSIYGGKYASKNTLWQTSDLLWDGDINVEGVSYVQSKGMYFLNANFWILDEVSGAAKDPSMFAIQPGIKTGIPGDGELKFAVAFYGFNNVQGNALDNSAGSNTLDGNKKLKNNYDSYNPGLELAFEGKAEDAKRFTIFSDFVTNKYPDKENKGFLYGVSYGDKKAKSPGQWQVKYNYRELEKDAWIDTFPDSDFEGGKTDAKGHELILDYAIVENVNFCVDYYTTSKKSDTKATNNVLQLDVNVKF